LFYTLSFHVSRFPLVSLYLHLDFYFSLFFSPARFCSAFSWVRFSGGFYRSSFLGAAPGIFCRFFCSLFLSLSLYFLPTSAFFLSYTLYTRSARSFVFSHVLWVFFLAFSPYMFSRFGYTFRFLVLCIRFLLLRSYGYTGVLHSSVLYSAVLLLSFYTLFCTVLSLDFSADLSLLSAVVHSHATAFYSFLHCTTTLHFHTLLTGSHYILSFHSSFSLLHAFFSSLLPAFSGNTGISGYTHMEDYA